MGALKESTRVANDFAVRYAADHTAKHYTQSVDEIANLSGAPDTRLAIYGTLAPGRVNHHQISALAGKWQRGTVRGQLFSSGWGVALGFPGVRVTSFL